MNTASSRSGQLDLEPLGISFFPSHKGLSKTERQLTLRQLHELIVETSASDKAKLPLLKMGRFGEQRGPKGGLANKANLLHITGIEVEHEGGSMSYKAAKAALQAAGLRAIIYTTPSHVPISDERWRILLPLSCSAEPEARHALVARLNAVLDGQLHYDSFVPWSRLFYYGSVSDGFRSDLLDGDCIDTRADLVDEREPEIITVTKSGTFVVRTMTVEEAWETLRKAGAREHEGWHNAMLKLTSHYAEARWDQEAIIEILAPHCLLGEDDPVMLDMVESAMAKFGRVDPGLSALKSLLTGKPEAAAVETPSAPSEPPVSAPLKDKVGWLLQTQAYLRSEDRVIELFETNENRCRSTLKATQTRFGHMFETIPGPRGGQPRKITAVAGWVASPDRINVEGVLMRPDQPFPLFSEGGRAVKNTYRKPLHEGSGGIETFMVFLTGFLPDERERNWLLDWMAHKLSRPEIPGPCVFFVADTEDDVREGVFGTGRGLFFSIEHRLYGVDYCRAQSFGVVDGSSSQSTFNDWMHGAVLVTIDEAQASPTAHRHGERRSVYEVLKEIVDPAPKLYAVRGKWAHSFQAISSASIQIATNHADAMAIPVNDRRFSVLRNGLPITRDMARALAAWRERPGNIAALAQFLAARDLSGFDMFQALETSGKADMAELSRTAMEDFMHDIMEDHSHGKAFTREQLRNFIANNSGFRNEFSSGHFEAAWRKMCSKVKGENGNPIQIRTAGTRRKVYCFNRHKVHIRNLPAATVLREVRKWGGIDTPERFLAGVNEARGDTEKDE